MSQRYSVSRRQLLQLAAGLSTALAVPSLVSATPSIIQLSLEARVREYLQRLHQQGILATDETWSWSAYDLTLDRKILALNENTPYQCASMVKPFIALAFFYKAQDNPSRFQIDENTLGIMEQMLRRSSNEATNHFIDLVSGRTGDPREVERLLKRRAPTVFTDTEIVERIPDNGRTYRNRASARDYSRFLHSLWFERFPHARQLKQLMGLANGDRIGGGSVAPQTEILDKTGTTARLCGNMGIVVAKDASGNRYPYLFVGLIEKAERTENYSQWAATRSNVIRQVSSMVYSSLQGVHPLL